MVQTLALCTIPFHVPFKGMKGRPKHCLSPLWERSRSSPSLECKDHSSGWRFCPTLLVLMRHSYLTQLNEWETIALHPIPTLTDKQIIWFSVWLWGFFVVAVGFCVCWFVCLFSFLKSSFCLMKTLLVVSRFKWWHSSISLLEKLQNGLGRLTWWCERHWKTTFGKR